MPQWIDPENLDKIREQVFVIIHTQTRTQINKVP